MLAGKQQPVYSGHKKARTQVQRRSDTAQMMSGNKTKKTTIEVIYGSPPITMRDPQTAKASRLRQELQFSKRGASPQRGEIRTEHTTGLSLETLP